MENNPCPGTMSAAMSSGTVFGVGLIVNQGTRYRFQQTPYQLRSINYLYANVRSEIKATRDITLACPECPCLHSCTYFIIIIIIILTCSIAVARC